MKNLSRDNLDWYLKFLYNLLICNMVAIRYVTATLGGNQVYRLLNLAIEEGHVTEREIETKKSGRKHKTKFLVITKKGMEYLRENHQELPQPMQWVGKISVPQAKIQYIERVMSAEQICRFLQVSGIGFLYNMFGMGENVVSSANYYAQLLKDNFETKKDANKLSVMIQSAKQYQVQAPTQPPNQDYEYVNSIQLKQQLRPWTGDDSRKYLGKLVGILFTSREAIFVYDSRDGKLAWNNETARAEIRLASMHSSHITPRPYFIDRPRIIVIIKSTGRLKEELKREKLWDEIHSFGEVMIVPLCFKALQDLKEYLSADYPQNKKRLMQIIENSGFQKNTDQKTNIFEFVHEDRLFFVGIHSELTQILRIRRLLLEKNINIKKIGVICFKWQEEMYRQAICHDDMVFCIFPED